MLRRLSAPRSLGDPGSWALVGFRNLEPAGIDAFEITDPIPVELVDDRWVRAS